MRSALTPWARAWLAREVPSRRRAAIIALLFLAAAVVAAVAGNFLPAVILGAGVILILIAYLVTYGAAWPSQEDGDRPG